jgi:hypothetical protein
MGFNNIHIEIYKVGIIGTVSLGVTDPMRIVTGTAGCLKVPDMLIMIIERFIIQNAGPAVTAIA